jgi:hypothetical protein
MNTAVQFRDNSAGLRSILIRQITLMEITEKALSDLLPIGLFSNPQESKNL